MDMTPVLEAKLGEGLKLAIDNLLDYKNNLDYDGHTFDRLELEQNLWDGFFGYVRVGLSLQNFARYKRYLKECRTFKQYCEKFLGISEGYAKKIMEATDVWVELVKAGFETLPNCYSQAMPLIKYNTGIDLEDNSQLWDQWQKCLDYATAINKPITAALVKKVVDRKDSPKKISVDNDVWELIDYHAAKAGLSKKEFLRKAIEQYINPPPPPEPIDKEKTQDWEKDLKDLIDEYDKSESSSASTNELLTDVQEQKDRKQVNLAKQINEKTVTISPILHSPFPKSEKGKTDELRSMVGLFLPANIPLYSLASKATRTPSLYGNSFINCSQQTGAKIARFGNKKRDSNCFISNYQPLKYCFIFRGNRSTIYQSISRANKISSRYRQANSQRVNNIKRKSPRFNADHSHGQRYYRTRASDRRRNLYAIFCFFLQYCWGCSPTFISHNPDVYVIIKFPRISTGRLTIISFFLSTAGRRNFI
jgi:hypothetical protein